MSAGGQHDVWMNITNKGKWEIEMHLHILSLKSNNNEDTMYIFVK